MILLEANHSSQFLSTFEEYRTHNFRGSGDLWVGELGGFLHGKMLQAFKVLQIAGDSYDSLKHKLLQWRRDSKESYEASSKERFTVASPIPKESLRLYAARLEKYFRLAYPNKSIENSSTLRRKFFHSVSSRFQNQLESARSIALTMNDRDITWTNILALASRFDIHKPSSNSGKYSQGSSTYSHVFGGYERRGNERSAVTNYGEDCCIYPVASAEEQSNQTYRDFISSTPRSKSTPRPRSTPLCSLSADFRSQPIVRPMSRHAPTATNFKSNPQCTYCHKDGHEHRNCWRRLGRCLMCGSHTHRRLPRA